MKEDLHERAFSVEGRTQRLKVPYLDLLARYTLCKLLSITAKGYEAKDCLVTASIECHYVSSTCCMKMLALHSVQFGRLHLALR